MTNNDIISSLKVQMCDELEEVADKLIENLTEKFREGLMQKRNSLIVGLLNGIDFLVSQDEVGRSVNVQINVKAGEITNEQRTVN